MIRKQCTARGMINRYCRMGAEMLKGTNECENIVFGGTKLYRTTLTEEIRYSVHDISRSRDYSSLHDS